MKKIVIKISGSIFDDKEKRKQIYRNIIRRRKKYQFVIVHGGKTQINEFFNKFGIKTEFKEGLRVTDKSSLEIIAAVLLKLNKEIVIELSNLDKNILPVGICGIDGNIIKAKKIKEFGYVGDIVKVNSNFLEFLLKNNFLPVISPICGGVDGETFLNVNADVVASRIAIALKADMLIFLSDVAGIFDKDGTIIKKINISQIQKLLKQKIITHGMIPKVKESIKALKNGVKNVYITDKFGDKEISV